MKDISFKAIIIGLLVDIGGTFAFAFAFGILAIILLTSTDGDIRQLEDFSRTPVFRTVTPIVGLLFTGLGGYMTARISKSEELKNAFFMGIASAAFGMISIFTLSGSETYWLDLIAMILTIFFAVLGGYAYTKTKGTDLQPKG